jgi:ABC-type transport system involved in multi-copper enzyme maturation permease subunit
MTVHARGYRPYAGGFERRRSIAIVAGEQSRLAFGRKSFKRIGIIYLMWFSMCLFFLYVVMGTDLGNLLQNFKRMFHGAEPQPTDLALAVLDQVLLTFYVGVGYLTALLAVFVGAGLISEDLATGALPLYLVRPIRPWEYVLGKALVLPGILAVALLVPGVLFYVIVGVWQRPGETWPFLAGNLDVLGAVAVTYLIAAAAYTGLMLLLSSLSRRQPTVTVMAGAVIFGGVLLGSLPKAAFLSGKLADLLLVVDLPHDVATPFLWRMREYRQEVHWHRLVSSPSVLTVALALFALGTAVAWWRARSVEVVS